MSTEYPQTSRYLRNDTALLLGLAVFTFLLHMLVSAFADYGYFIDEFYYIACSKHLALGYVDQPPLSIYLLAINRWVLGDSLPALRFLPSIVTASTVFFTGLITRKLGGRTAAQGIAALASLIAPAYLVFGGFYSMNPFELLMWTLVMYFTIRLLQEENLKLWLIIGTLVGLGLEMKHTMILYVVALAGGMIVAPARRFLRNRWFAYGCLIAFGLLLPNIIWQILNGFPSLEFYRNAIIYKNIPTSPLGVFIDQILILSPITLPLWVMGLASLFTNKEGKKYRAFGWCYLILFLFMLISQSSRPDRITSIYPILFATGALAIEQYSASIHRHWLLIVSMVLITIGGLVTVPISVPVLPPATLVKYMSAIGFSMNIEKGKSSQLPQWFADRFGWKELAAEVSTIYHSLRPQLRNNCVIITGSYGQAGALEFFGKEYGLPPVYSTHNSYHSWGPPPDSAKTYIGVLVSQRDMEGFFKSVVIAGISSCEYCMSYEREIPIFVARDPTGSVKEIWPKLKRYE